MTDSINRVVPIHDRPSAGLTTYDAKDPEKVFPPIGRGADDSSHLISPEDRLRVAMVRQ